VRDAVSDKYRANARDVKINLAVPSHASVRGVLRSIICLVFATILEHFPKIILTVELRFMYCLVCGGQEVVPEARHQNSCKLNKACTLAARTNTRIHLHRKLLIGGQQSICNSLVFWIRGVQAGP